MSVYFEAVVVAADENTVVQSLEDLSEQNDRPFATINLGLHRVADRGFIIFCWRAGARRPHCAAEAEDLAVELSRDLGTAVAVHYDDQVGLRAAILSQTDKPVRYFGEADEVWVPYAEDGGLVTDGLRYTGDSIPDDVECDCIRNGIDVALEAAGFQAWATSAELVQAAYRNDPVWQRPGATQ